MITTTIEPVLVEVTSGCMIYRYGRAWVAGDRLHLLPSEAARLAGRGTVWVVG